MLIRVYFKEHPQTSWLQPVCWVEIEIEYNLIAYQLD